MTDGKVRASLGLLWSLEAFLEPPGGPWSLFGSPLGGLGVLLGLFWGILEPLRVLLGGPGASWGGLGASWAPLGPSWRRPKCDTDNMPKKGQLPDPSTQNHVPLWGAFWEAKMDQNRTQNESKFKTIFKSEKVALQEPLGAVLGLS